MATTQLPDLEEAELAYNRVKSDIEALNAADLSAMNVDPLSATSIAIGVAERILAHRERMAKLPEFDVRNVDKLLDYAKATWFVYVTNLPTPEPSEAATLFDEVAALRGKLLMWARPLVGAGHFDEAGIAKIKEGSGNKDLPSDLVALVALYRSKWDGIKNICGVTEEDLNRGALIGPAMFALVSRRENQTGTSVTDGALRVRRAWTLLDRAYLQCRRALDYLRWDEADVDVVAPSLRKNSGMPSARPKPTAHPTEEPVIQASNASAPSPVSISAPSIGGNSGPFMAKS